MSQPQTEAFDELGPEEVSRRMELFATKFTERNGREMGMKEFHDFQTCWERGFVALDAMGNEVFSEQFLLAASVLAGLGDL